ncbi:ABC transporter permease [Ideonella sp. 4Y16]|uniref:ABC transporter permease n=1 Tax=Ideonella alba TaxID=2824118 RepID=A0A941BHA0_9BURK|nr:FtsX-like permease family protein [Ideonella alba]MBQ0932927.1 ABC transporter permease [Ideonella alba]MBQ0942666.1 ABC transporter permease [Ideonella alba]
MKWLSYAWRNTLRNRRRSAVTVTIAAMGTAAILMAGGFALSTYQALAESSARSSGHLVIGQPAQFERDEDIPLQHGLDDWPRLQKQLLADPAVRQVLPRVEFSGLVSNGEKSTVMLAVGIAPDAEFAIKGPFLTVTAGQVLSDADRASVMLGEALARSLKATPGSSLTLLASTTEGALNAMDVTVKGVFSTGVPDIDKRLVYTDVSTAQRLLVSQRISSAGVFLDRMDATAPAQARWQAALPGLAVRTWVDQAPFYRSVKDLYNRIFGALGLIIGVIVVFVVTNAMAMAIVERTREIGTLRAMGTLPGQLIGSFALEGLVLGGAGTALGALIAGGVSLLLVLVPVQMPPPPGRSVGYPLLVSPDPLLYALTIGAVLALAVIAAALVARRTVHLSVVDALAHV